VGEGKGVGMDDNVRSDGDEIVLVLVGVSGLSGMCREAVGRVFLRTFGTGGFLFSRFSSLSVRSKSCLLVMEFSRENVAERVERVRGLLDEATLGTIPLRSPR
jgi:hypothetical protein